MKAIHKTDLMAPANPADGLISDAEWELAGQLFGLSHRELTVARRLFAGESREQIALTLRKSDGTSLSPETVRVYIDRLWRKLNVSNQMQMAIRILRVHSQLRQTDDGSPHVTDSVTRVGSQNNPS